MTSPYSLKNRRIYVAGHTGLVGGAVCRRLEREECTILTAGRKNLDCRNQAAVHQWFADHRPDAVIICAAKVGGIAANMAAPADFIADNLSIALNLIQAAHAHNVGRLIFLGSSCMYPRDCAQPMRECDLLTGALEPTNEPYAMAKLSGMMLCTAMARQHGRDYFTVIPPNLYGPGDNFHPENAHVPAALLARFHTAKNTVQPFVTVWGTGNPRREFMHVDDLADGLVYALKHYKESGNPLNIGTGEAVSIADFAGMIKAVTRYEGEIVFDPSRPDGMPVKCMDISRMTALGWHPSRTLEQGLAAFYQWYRACDSGDLRAA